MLDLSALLYLLHTELGNFFVFQMEHHLLGGLGAPMKGILTGEVRLLESNNVNVAWMRVAWISGISAIVMQTRMNGNEENNIFALVGNNPLKGGHGQLSIMQLTDLYWEASISYTRENIDYACRAGNEFILWLNIT